MHKFYLEHMNKAMRQLKNISLIADIFIIVLDARSPISSYNKNFDKFNPSKPKLFIISKIDLGDEKKYFQIKKIFNLSNSVTLFLNLKKIFSRKKIFKAIKKLNPIGKPLKIIVVGPPNSGKSTLINLLSENQKVKVGNEPGITKNNTWINLNDEYNILDTPGVIWPEKMSEEVFSKLIIIGAINKSFFDLERTFTGIFKVISKYYPKKIEDLGLKISHEEKNIYNQSFKMAKKKLFFKKGGSIDPQRAMEFFIEKIKQTSGITLE